MIYKVPKSQKESVIVVGVVVVVVVVSAPLYFRTLWCYTNSIIIYYLLGCCYLANTKKEHSWLQREGVPMLHELSQ